MLSTVKRRVKAYINGIPAPIYYLFSAGLVILSAYHFYYSNKIVPGVVLAGIDLGGLSYEQAREKVHKKEAETGTLLELKTGAGKIYQIKTSEVELTYDWDAGITRSFEVGRTGHFYTDTKDKIAGLIKPLKINAIHSYNKDLLGGRIAEIRSEINVPSISAKISLNASSGTEIIPEVYGKSLDEERAYKTVRESFDNLDFTPKQLNIEDEDPQFTKSDLEKVLNETHKLVSRQIELKSGDKKFILGPQELIKLVSFSKEESGTRIRLNKDELEKVRQNIAREVNKLPMGEVVSVRGGRVQEFRIIQEGLEIDKDKFTGQFKELFNSGRAASMEIPLKEIKTSKNGSEYGIFALLGAGVSRFTGSAQPRITNLTLAAKRTSGVLVPPGKEYSFNRAVGEISAKTGYATAYIISQGRTVLGEGGGVCQTSTTLFRAVLNAGLPITSRHPHAYRVNYYEIESPVGYDASVYQPSLDFKFINDTPGYVLIQYSVDLATNTLEFKIYGTPDGRKVEFSEPKLYNVSGPPASLYQDDPTLAKGVVRQIDFSAPGGIAEFTRKVTKGDKVLFEDTFKSVYQPWRAIFLVGTKE